MGKKQRYSGKPESVQHNYVICVITESQLVFRNALKSGATSHNFKVSLKIITVSSVSRSKERSDSSELPRTHDRNHKKHSAHYHYYSFKLSASISSYKDIYGKHLKR